MRLLHIIDDYKFISFCRNTFDIDSLENFYLKSGLISLRYLLDHKIDLIIIHYLYDKEVDFFYDNKINIPKIWMFWGADGFSLPLFYNKFLDRDSLKVNDKIKFNSGIREYYKHKVKIIFNKFWNNGKSAQRKIHIINQMDYIIPVVPGDFDLLKEKYNIQPKFYHFNYVVDFIGDVSEKTGGNILLGNSASISNNHISILKQLNSLKLGDRKIYIPLSYGNEKYKKYVLDFIDELNNHNIIPLNDFMRYEDYGAIINSCDIMIMNHHRQQALGNVILGLINGCTIYMNENSTLYLFLKNKNFAIKDTSNMSKVEVLNEKEKKHNCNLAKQIFGKERQIKLVKKLINVYK